MLSSHRPCSDMGRCGLEQKMFRFISIDWQARELVTYLTVVELIGITTTSKEPTTRAEEDFNYYSTGTQASATAQLHDRPISPY
jgi:hypothetical protein